MEEKITKLNDNLCKLNGIVNLINEITGDLNEEVKIDNSNLVKTDFSEKGIILDDKTFCKIINILSFCSKENLMDNELFSQVISDSKIQLEKRREFETRQKAKKQQEMKHNIETLHLNNCNNQKVGKSDDQNEIVKQILNSMFPFPVYDTDDLKIINLEDLLKK